MSSDVCERQHRGRPLLDYPEAIGLLMEQAQPLSRPPQLCPLRQASGRVTAEAVVLDRLEPPVARSAMDGYAVRSGDGRQSRRIRGTVYAGTSQVPPVGDGEAVAVMTGGTIPPGADAVVPVELTRVETSPDSDQGQRLYLDAEVKAGQHVRPAGEMGDRGRLLLPAGRLLSLTDVVAAAGCGHDPIRVGAKPKVAVLSTGDEVVSWRKQPQDHQVRDSNRLGAALQMERAGAEVIATRRVRDEPEELRLVMEAALEASDLVITIGGVSMGEKDHLPQVFEQIGLRKLFHGVRVQPGKPVWAGERDGRWVLGLPGNPMSSFVILELFGAPLVQRLAGAQPAVPRPLEIGIAGGTARTKARERFLPADLSVSDDGRCRVHPRPQTGSGDWTSLAGCDALLSLPAHTQVEEGEAVRFLRL